MANITSALPENIFPHGLGFLYTKWLMIFFHITYLRLTQWTCALLPGSRMSWLDKQPGHKSWLRKPAHGSQATTRARLVVGADCVIVTTKVDGTAALCLEDRGLMYPKSQKRLPLADCVMAQFRKECEGLTGPIAFELVCKQSRRQHNFHQVSGLCNLSRSNYLTLAEFHSRNLTLVAITAYEGETARDRIGKVWNHFRGGRVQIDESGKWIWPYDAKLGDNNLLVSVLPSEEIQIFTMEADLAFLLKSASKEGSPKLEGFVCHMVYPRGHVKNQLQKWGERAHKNFQYYADNNMKVKREGAIKLTVTGVFHTTQHVGSEMPHEDWPKRETYCAIVKCNLPDGSIKIKDTIPLESVLAGKILGALTHKCEIEAWGWSIDWYYNTDRTDKNEDPIRFLKLNSIEYDPFDKCHVREQHADGSVLDKFACETPATRKFSAKSTQEQCKIKDARGKQAAKRQQLLEESDQFNLHTGEKYSKAEMKRKREFNEVNKGICAKLADALFLHFPEEAPVSPPPKPKKVCTPEEIAAKKGEIVYLTNLFEESKFTNRFFSEHMRKGLLERASVAGLEVNETTWPVADSPSAVYRAMWRADASDADKQAMVVEKAAVRRMIDRAREEHRYFNPEDRKTLTKRAVECGIHIMPEDKHCTDVNDISWPKLTKVQSDSMQKLARTKRLADM